MGTMKYAILNEFGGGYGAYTVQTRVSKATYFRELTNIATVSIFGRGTFGVVSSEVRRLVGWWPRFIRRWYDTYVMCLDCDGLASATAAAHTLATDGIGYAMIESSEGHYWFITDYCGRLGNITRKMLSIPGVDKSYIDSVDARSSVVLRGVTFCDRVPRFPDTTTLTNKHSILFYNRFRDLYSHKLMLQRTNSLRLARAVEDGNIFDLAADPEFVV